MYLKTLLFSVVNADWILNKLLLASSRKHCSPLTMRNETSNIFDHDVQYDCMFYCGLCAAVNPSRTGHI